ncbi:MAG TPA: AraC family transcriptional regulator [Longimicrobiales bacterium]|nr:AraC family transcriptional regulator [Longimicrobiales bacterium]
MIRVNLNLAGITRGQVAHESKFGPWTLTGVTYAPGARYPAHAHEQPYVCLVLSGGFREEHRSRVEEAEAGSVVFMPAGQSHQDKIADRGARSFVITMDRTRVRQQPACWHVERAGPFARSMLSILKLAQAGLLDQTTIEESLLAAWDALAQSKCTPASPAVARRARDYLTAHRDEPLRLGAIANELGVSRSYLARAFRHAFGCTMGIYQRRLRLQQAMGLIADGNSLARAAAAAGFADQSHLSRVIRRELDLTAAGYRSLARSAVS